MAKKQALQQDNESIGLEVTEINGTPVDYVRLHENLFIPGVGDLGKAINMRDKTSKYKDMFMAWNGHALEFEHKGHKGFIPGANISSGLFKKES